MGQYKCKHGYSCVALCIRSIVTIQAMPWPLLGVKLNFDAIVCIIYVCNTWIASDMQYSSNFYAFITILLSNYISTNNYINYTHSVNHNPLIWLQLYSRPDHSKFACYQPMYTVVLQTKTRPNLKWNAIFFLPVSLLCSIIITKCLCKC